jgi:hypothetical protein
MILPGMSAFDVKNLLQNSLRCLADSRSILKNLSDARKSDQEHLDEMYKSIYLFRKDLIELTPPSLGR